MKTKAKLILAMSVLTAGVVAAGATGTFAWFTTNRAAQLNYTSVTAQKNAGNLDVVMGLASAGVFQTGSPAEVPSGGSIATVTKASGAKMSDVSSANGFDFAKPIWKTVAGEGQLASSFQKGAWGIDYTTFWFSVSNSGNNPLDVYLNSATAITATPVEGVGEEQTAQTAKNVAAAKYTRVAIAQTVVSDIAGVAKALTAAPGSNWLLENNAGTNRKYVPLPESLTTEKKVERQDLPTGTVKSFILDSANGADKITTVSSSGGHANAKLCKLTAKGTAESVAYFAVSVWLEGTKADNTDFDAALGGQVNITLDFAGVEAAA